MSSDPLQNPNEEEAEDEAAEANPAQILVFHAHDATGACGLTADALSIAALGGHLLGVCTGVYIKDTLRIHDFYPLEQDAIHDQAVRIFEDAPVHAIKVGFLGSVANVQAVAEILSDYPDTPVIATMSDLSWWDEDKIEDYLDAFASLILPMADVLIGQADTLERWLLPDWTQQNKTSRRPSARDFARTVFADSAQDAYVLLTGQGEAPYVENSLANAQTTLVSQRKDRTTLTYSGAGDTLSGAFTTLIAQNCGLIEAFQEATEYTEQSLLGGFQPGMGSFIPDRLFEAPDNASDEENTESTSVH